MHAARRCSRPLSPASRHLAPDVGVRRGRWLGTEASWPFCRLCVRSGCILLPATRLVRNFLADELRGWPYRTVATRSELVVPEWRTGTQAAHTISSPWLAKPSVCATRTARDVASLIECASAATMA